MSGMIGPGFTILLVDNNLHINDMDQYIDSLYILPNILNATFHKTNT